MRETPTRRGHPLYSAKRQHPTNTGRRQSLGNDNVTQPGVTSEPQLNRVRGMGASRQDPIRQSREQADQPMAHNDWHDGEGRDRETTSLGA